jgi:hypothetical protein
MWLGDLWDLKVKMIVVAASRIESRITSRAVGITLPVLENGQHRTARATKNRLLVPFIFRPDCNRMIGERVVAILASIVKTATFHLDGDDVSRSVIMLTTGL